MTLRLRTLALPLLLFGLSSTLGAQQAPAAPSPLQAALAADPLVVRALQAVLAMQQRLSWEQGVLGQYFVECDDQPMIQACARAMLMFVSKDGVVNARGGSFVDPLMGGETLMLGAHLSQDPQLQAAFAKMLDFAETRTLRTSDGIICHNADKKTLWADTVHTAAPFLAVAGHHAEAVRQITGAIDKLWDPDLQLIMHFWGEDRQARSGGGWASGCGWVCVGTMRVIRALPSGMADERKALIALLTRILDGALKRQKPDGLFPNIMEKPETYSEACSAAMIAFAIFEGVRGSWLPGTYLPAAQRMRAAVRAKVDRFGLVQDACGAPKFSDPGTSPEAQAFFLMMEASAAKLDAAARTDR